jgi:hypothetical protein
LLLGAVEAQGLEVGSSVASLSEEDLAALVEDGDLVKEL